MFISHLKAINDSKYKIPGPCIEGYIVGALPKMVGKALDKHDEIMDDGYDTKVRYFATAVRDQWKANTGDFFTNHIDEYFNCYRETNGKKSDHPCPPFDKSTGMLAKIILKVRNEEKLKKFILEMYDIN